MPDRGGQREDALGEGGDAHWRAGAVQFQVELAFEGIARGLDELADGFEEMPARLAGACGCGRRAAAAAPPFGQVGVEFGRYVALVGQDQQPGTAGRQTGSCWRVLAIRAPLLRPGCPWSGSGGRHMFAVIGWAVGSEEECPSASGGFQGEAGSIGDGRVRPLARAVGSHHRDPTSSCPSICTLRACSVLSLTA